MRRYTQLGKTLKAARNAKGWSQEKLARKLYTTRQRVILWEKGSHKPHPRYRVALERFLSAEFDWTPDIQEMTPEETAADIETERYADEMVA